MKVALIYPPTCDPTAPYLALPALTGWLRSHGVEVLPIDANLEAWEFLLTPERLSIVGARLERRLSELERQSALSHADQLAYSVLWGARAEAARVPLEIEDALATFRDHARFFDAAQYERAVQVVQAAQDVLSAAYTPLAVDFVSYRTPLSLLTPEEIARDAAPDANPFHDYFTALAERLAEQGVGLVGLSVAFPGQIQPAFSLAYALRARLPDLHITVGGPALSQLLLRLTEPTLSRVIGPFSTAIAYEGEFALLELITALERGESPRGLIRGRTVEDMSQLPPPDFVGLPLDRYFSPELVLPYDPTRGCYWGVCTFCHYGLAEVGTARHRERPSAVVLDHLEQLSRRHGTKVFYFSQDAFAPRVARQIALGIKERGLPVRWGSDMRPERSLSPERCQELVAGGALSAALGVESAAPRVLQLIDKGIGVDDIRRVVRNLSQAGFAVEAMCFSDFPTESYREALQTVRLIEELKDDLSLFILGRFDLTHGSLVAQKPGEFGIKEVWHIEGDELKTGLFFQEKQRSKSPTEHAKLEDKVGQISSHWALRRYPWAGALSTAHTLLWYAHFGPGAFRQEATVAAARQTVPARRFSSRFDVERVSQDSEAHEAEIWRNLVEERRRVSRSEYHALAERLPKAHPSPGLWSCAAGVQPRRVREREKGRRPSHSVNATRR